MPSAPVIPYDDPTILFTNAGMCQFKDVFTGRRKLDYSRAASSQKCIRAGGKHNDLDNVGFTARHLTFFEMLGNFSFGDYFKEETIVYGWEWVTKELQLRSDRLYATVYETDDDAFGLWEKIAPELKNGRVLRFGKKDNYWSMGEIGPCGPSSEIHYDRGERFGTGPQAVINGESDRFVEIWNLVFMQYDQLSDGRVTDLPKPSVDTGAGLERITSVMQDSDSVFGIDLFEDIIGTISDMARVRYRDHPASHHVIADHVRALTFAIADGAGISNEGQGYVLRRILRRAARHGRLLGLQEPFLHKLVPVLVNTMGDAFPEVREEQQHAQTVIRVEEESFNRTLETGLQMFAKVAAWIRGEGGSVVPGDDVFRLYDTYGFPYDLTEIIAAEQDLALDRAGFEQAMARQKEQSRAAAEFGVYASLSGMQSIPEETPSTVFRRECLKLESTLLWVSTPSSIPSPDEPVAVILRETPFYAEAGGQISDTGRIYTDRWELSVSSVLVHQGWYLHEGKLTQGRSGHLRARETVTAEVDGERRWDIMRNHTATHLAHAALRKVLGDHIKQSGSYVGPDRLRFDFSHHQPLTPEEIEEVEALVNGQVIKATRVATETMDLESAKRSGAMALFGERYADKVRVVSVGGFSMELCGGTHVDDVSQIGPFFITLETGVASGVRRLEAITGREAVRHMLALKDFRRQVASVVGRPEPDALAGVMQLSETCRTLQKELKRARAAMFSGTGQSVGRERKVGDCHVVTSDFEDTDRETMASWVDSWKNRAEPRLAFALGTVNGKLTYLSSASSAAVSKYGVDMDEIARNVLPEFGGRGGGKPSFAQGSVASATVASELFDAACSYIEKKWAK